MKRNTGEYAVLRHTDELGQKYEAVAAALTNQKEALSWIKAQGEPGEVYAVVCIKRRVSVEKEVRATIKEVAGE